MKRGQLVSIIVTTRNEEKVIKQLLDSIQRQSYKNFEVILVDNDSADKTITIARKYPIKIIQGGPERSAQRNLGAKASKGKYLLFVDADMQLSKNILEQCVEKAETQQLGAVVIPESSKVTNFWEKVKGFERSFYNERGDPVTDAARFFSRKAFLVGGRYDESITGPEDWDLPETIKEKGFTFGKISSKILHTERISSPFELARKKFYYGLRAHKYLKKHKIPAISPKTIYFLRPVFYKNIHKIIAHPILSIGMVIMLFIEQVAGGLGYFIGRVRKF